MFPSEVVINTSLSLSPPGELQEIKRNNIDKRRKGSELMFMKIDF